MTPPIIANLEKLLRSPRDNALLRYAIGNEWLKAGDPAKAAEYFRDVLGRDPKFTAAWKLLGKALTETGQLAEALEAYKQGCIVADARGDIQAAKEMRVFSRRIEKQLSGGEEA